MNKKMSTKPIGLNLSVDDEQFFVGLKQKIANDAKEEEVKIWLEEVQSRETDADELLIPTQSTVQQLLDDFKIARQNNRLLKCTQLQEWFRQNTHLPQPSGPFIYKFLWAAKDDEERAKKTILKFYSLRGADEEIFGNRDPYSPAAEENFKTTSLAAMPYFTEDIYRITISRLQDYNVDHFSAVHYIRRLMFIADLRVRSDLSLGEIMIFDLIGFSLNHLMKFTLPLTKKMVLAAEGAVPIKLKQIHLVNCPSFIDRILALFRPFIKDKIANRIIVHTQGNEKLQEYIPRKMLPTEYGGSAGPIAEFSLRWENEIKRNRDWFINEEKTIKRLHQEAKTKGQLFIDSGELFGMEGTFKKLSID